MELLVTQLQNGNPYALGLLISGLSALAILFSLWRQYQVWNWPWVWGEMRKSGLTKATPASTPSDHSYMVELEYLYKVNGHSYAGKRLSAMQVVTSHNARALLQRQLDGVEAEGERVKVYYDPATPEQSFLIKGSWIQIVSSLCFLFIAFSVASKCLSSLHL